MNENGFLINNFSRKSKHFSRNLAMLGAMILIVGAGIFASIKFFTQDANATLAGFNPGNIIDDATMSNKNSMSESDIQNFLNDKFGGNYKGGSPNGYGVRAYPGYQYHVENGHFVPLAQEKFGNNGLPAAGGQSSAHVVWQAAQDYSINPQVLLVILQKEQGLISDNWPNYTQYASATGFGCPDTAACDPSYGGFIAQVRNAAAFFRKVLNGGWTNYPVGQNYIQYNPNAACGGSVINVQNRATSALYRYTPYQPNASAMAAGWGTGDSCGAYGNRNFYNYFTSWFGSTKVQGAAGLMGNIDSVSYDSNSKTINVSGWSFDYANTNNSNDIHLYIGSPAGENPNGPSIISVNQQSSDVNSFFGISGNHRFSASIPFANNCDANYKLYFYGMGLNGEYNKLISSDNSISINSGRSCIYRLYNPANGDHFYTSSSSEKDYLSKSGSWSYEGVAWYAQ